MTVSPSEVSKRRMELVGRLEDLLDARILRGNLIGALPVSEVSNILNGYDESFLSPITEVLIAKYTTAGWHKVVIEIHKESIWISQGGSRLSLKFAFEEQ